MAGNATIAGLRLRFEINAVKRMTNPDDGATKASTITVFFPKELLEKLKLIDTPSVEAARLNQVAQENEEATKQAWASQDFSTMPLPWIKVPAQLLAEIFAHDSSRWKSVLAYYDQRNPAACSCEVPAEFAIALMKPADYIVAYAAYIDRFRKPQLPLLSKHAEQLYYYIQDKHSQPTYDMITADLSMGKTTVSNAIKALKAKNLWPKWK